jgi:hypothetical protein
MFDNIYKIKYKLYSIIREFYESEECTDTNPEDALITYFMKMRKENNADEQRAYAPTTMRGWFSMFKAFWLHTGRGDLEALVPLISTKLNHWQAAYITEKASTFTKEDMG